MVWHILGAAVSQEINRQDSFSLRIWHNIWITFFQKFIQTVLCWDGSMVCCKGEYESWRAGQMQSKVAQSCFCIPVCWNNTTAVLNKLACPPLRHQVLLYCLLLVTGTILPVCVPLVLICSFISSLGIGWNLALVVLLCKDAAAYRSPWAPSWGGRYLLKHSRGWFPGQPEALKKKLLAKACHQLHAPEEDQGIQEPLTALFSPTCGVPCPRDRSLSFSLWLQLARAKP